MKIGSKDGNNHRPAGFSTNYWCLCVCFFFQKFFLNEAFIFLCPTAGNRGDGGWNCGLAKYGLFSRLNSTNGPHCLEEFDFLPFCVRALSLTRAGHQPTQPYQPRSGCETEQLSSAPDPKLWKRTTGKWTGVRRTGTGREENNFLGGSHCCLFALVHSHFFTSWTHLSMQTEAHWRSMNLAYCVITLECSPCVKCARRPIDGAPSGKGFIRSNLPLLSSCARSQSPNRLVFYRRDKGHPSFAYVRNTALSALRSCKAWPPLQHVSLPFFCAAHHHPQCTVCRPWAKNVHKKSFCWLWLKFHPVVMGFRREAVFSRQKHWKRSEKGENKAVAVMSECRRNVTVPLNTVKIFHAVETPDPVHPSAGSQRPFLKWDCAEAYWWQWGWRCKLYGTIKVQVEAAAITRTSTASSRTTVAAALELGSWVSLRSRSWSTSV